MVMVMAFVCVCISVCMYGLAYTYSILVLMHDRSGKIMRRILRKIASGEEDSIGDVSTLADPSVVQKLVERFRDVYDKK